MHPIKPWMSRSMLSATVALAAAANIAVAQCPDGTPPPCKRPVAVPMLRRTNPPLDVRAWIVVPFGNVMKAQDLDWLRDASVNLTLDLGRWTDIRVVPDKRVGDLLRELPPLQAGSTLTLSDGLSIARRAGAGWLVMGDFFRTGKGARLVANVFDVATGAKLRSAVQQAGEQDSLLTAFTPLARGVLAVPPPSDAAMGELGTTRLDAYQEYLLGVRSMNADQMPLARQHLERAIALDSTFALAHFQLSYVLGWGDKDGQKNDALQHALAAARLGARLPRRERALIESLLALTSGENAKACSTIAPIVARDSFDIQALLALGECSYHNDDIVVSASDTTSAKHVGSWNVALRAFQHVVELDPSYYVAFVHTYDIHQATSRFGCVPGPGLTRLQACRKWRSIVLRSGDSLETVPVLASGSAYAAQVDRAMAERTPLLNLTASKAMAERWVLADSTSDRAHTALARALLALGEVEAAHREFARTSMNGTGDNLLKLRLRVEVAIKLGKGAEARMLLDSLMKINAEAPSTQFLGAVIDVSTGHFARWDAVVAGRAAALGPTALAYYRQTARALMGLTAPDLDRLSWAYSSSRDSTCDRNCRLLDALASHGYVIGLPNPTWSPTLAPPFTDVRHKLMHAITTGDTTAIRSAASSLEKTARTFVHNGVSESGQSMLAANGYLTIHDSAAALVAARFFVDTAMAVLTIQSSSFCLGVGMCVAPAPLWPRMMLLRADLEVAKGRPEAAKVWYDRLLDLWSTADAEFQPVVERVRKARGALGK